MGRTLCLVFGLVLLSACAGRRCRPRCQVACATPAQAQAAIPHLILRTTRLNDPLAEKPQVLLEATIFKASPQVVARLGGREIAPNVRLLPTGHGSLLAAFEDDRVHVLQLPSVVTLSGEEAVVEITDDDGGESFSLRTTTKVDGIYTVIAIDYKQSDPKWHLTSGTLRLQDGASIVFTRTGPSDGPIQADPSYRALHSIPTDAFLER